MGPVTDDSPRVCTVIAKPCIRSPIVILGRSLKVLVASILLPRERAAPPVPRPPPIAVLLRATLLAPGVSSASGRAEVWPRGCRGRLSAREGLPGVRAGTQGGPGEMGCRRRPHFQGRSL